MSVTKVELTAYLTEKLNAAIVHKQQGMELMVQVCAARYLDEEIFIKNFDDLIESMTIIFDTIKRIEETFKSIKENDNA